MPIKFGSSLLLFIIISLHSFGQENDAAFAISIVQKMIDKGSAIKSLKYTIDKEERINGKIARQISFTKLTIDPFKIYLRQSFPKDGMEVLFDESKYKKALINPNGFPWINLWLNPHDGIMRNNQHHTIFHSGFNHTLSILQYQFNKYESSIENMVTYNGIVQQDGRDSYSVTFNNLQFKYIDYTVKEGESVEDISAKYKISESIILDINKNIKDYDDIETGQVIKIPNDYALKIILYIDKKELVPVLIDIYDEKGRYEKYEYSNLEVNPVIPAEEFSEDFKQYGF